MVRSDVPLRLPEAAIQPDDGFPPRGFGRHDRSEVPPDAAWRAEETIIANMQYKEGDILVGECAGRWIGHGDDRHLVMLAGSRSGKTATVLKPNLLRYRGPCIVIDPKGELARATALYRKQFGPVHILDPFEEVVGRDGFEQSGYNPFAELKHSKFISADSAQIAEALIVSPPDSKDPHWTDTAKILVQALVLYLAATKPRRATLSALRALIVSDVTTLFDVFVQMSVDDDPRLKALGLTFKPYAETNDNGVVKTWNKEMKSILSVAKQQTAFLDELGPVSDRSSFGLGDIVEQNMTIYLVLPALRLSSHAKWLRLLIMQSLFEMERIGADRSVGPGEHLLFVLEEFASLGHVEAIENAAGYMAGFGVKLWVVLQDLPQLQRHYQATWETFLGNAGIIQAFGNVDITTTEYLSKRLGNTRYLHVRQDPAHSGTIQHGDFGIREDLQETSLLAPDEIPLYFSRERNRQMVLIPGASPMYMNRLPFSAGELQRG